MPWANIGQVSVADVEIMKLVNSDQMCEVMVRCWGCIADDQEREPLWKLLRFTHYKSANPQNCPPRVVCPVP